MAGELFFSEADGLGIEVSTIKNRPDKLGADSESIDECLYATLNAFD